VTIQFLHTGSRLSGESASASNRQARRPVTGFDILRTESNDEDGAGFNQEAQFKYIEDLSNLICLGNDKDI